MRSGRTGLVNRMKESPEESIGTLFAPLVDVATLTVRVSNFSTPTLSINVTIVLVSSAVLELTLNWEWVVVRSNGNLFEVRRARGATTNGAGLAGVSHDLVPLVSAAESTIHVWSSAKSEVNGDF